MKSDFNFIKPDLQLIDFNPKIVHETQIRKNLVIHNVNNEYDKLIEKTHKLKSDQEKFDIKKQTQFHGKKINIITTATIFIFIIGVSIGIYYAKITCNQPRTWNYNNRKPLKFNLKERYS